MLFRTSVGPPYIVLDCLPPAPYEFLTANHILGPRPASAFCKIKTNGRKDYCKKCRRPRRAGHRPICSLYLLRGC